MSGKWRVSQPNSSALESSSLLGVVGRPLPMPLDLSPSVSKRRIISKLYTVLTRASAVKTLAMSTRSCAKHVCRLAQQAVRNFRRASHRYRTLQRVRLVLLRNEPQQRQRAACANSAACATMRLRHCSNAVLVARHSVRKKKETSGTSCDAPRCTPVIDGSY